MKARIFILLVMPLLIGCDFESVLDVENNRTETIQINVEGDPIYVYGPLKLIKEEGNMFMYELEGLSQHRFVQLVNEHIEPSNIPFNKLEIVTSADTIKFEDQNDIFNRMETIAEDYYKIIVQ